MIFRKADSRDCRQLIDLWGKVFGDDEAESTSLLYDFAGKENIYLAEKNGHIVAQLLAVPCEAGGEKGTYLYALATEPEHRSQGIMGNLMEYVEEQTSAAGGRFFVLIPASASLFNYYEAYGFENVFMWNIELSLAGTDNDDFDTGEIPVDIFVKLRSKFLNGNTVTFSKARTAFELEEQWYFGCSSVYCEDGYCIFLKADSTLFVTEIAALDQRTALKLISFAKKQTGCAKVNVTLPADSHLFPRSAYTGEQTSAVHQTGCPEKQTSTVQPTAYPETQLSVVQQAACPAGETFMIRHRSQTLQAQYKWWGSGVPPKFYLRFAMDDLSVRILANHADIIV